MTKTTVIKELENVRKTWVRLKRFQRVGSGGELWWKKPYASTRGKEDSVKLWTKTILGLNFAVSNYNRRHN